MTQKDAVFSAIVHVLKTANVNFQSSVTDVSDLLTKDLRSGISEILSRQFLAKEIDLSEEANSKLTDSVQLKNYVSGLISNWVRKDPRLNGGKTSSSSTRKSSSVDPQLKALKQLHSAQTDQAKRQEIQSFIDKRVAELN